MKNLMTIIMVLLVAGSGPGALAQKWQPVNAEFDSLTLKCETLTNTGVADSAFRQRVKRMYQLADEHHSDVMLWRTLYFDALGDQCSDRMDQAYAKGTKALEMVDSVAYPYDKHRIWWMVMRGTKLNSDFAEIYKHARRELEYYRKIGDDKMQGLMEINIFHALEYARLYDEAERYDQLIREHYGRAGFRQALLMREPEVMHFYMAKGDTLKAREIYREAERAILADPNDLSLFVLYHTAAHTGLDPAAAEKAYEIATNPTGEVRPSMLTAAHRLMGDYLLWHKNDPESALPHYRYSLEQNDNHSLFTRAEGKAIAQGLSECYSALGRNDSAYKYLQIYNHITDSLDEGNKVVEINRMNIQSQIESQEQQYIAERERSRNRVLVLCLALVAVVAAAFLIIRHTLMRKRLKEQENQLLASNLERERLERELQQERAESSERQLATNQLRMIEKDNAINHLKDEITERGNRENMDPALKRDLLNSIHVHHTTEESLSQFLEYFTQVHPAFFATLKERCPSLTKSNLRLCAYLRIGLDNKQIAQIMAVQPEAVKMARHRLRTKLGLDSSTSLDDFILSL